VSESCEWRGIAEFYWMVTTERCTFVARDDVVRRNMKIKLAVAFAVLVFASGAKADSIAENLTIDGGAASFTLDSADNADVPANGAYGIDQVFSNIQALTTAHRLLSMPFIPWCR
jgi:hypothetical protein